ncbi:uncharacterized protein LOC129588764 [Paramacrobiotus metropolitanus]|uniref:uncharacterized protein LOC129588764 n=1 Tax=Paramacrobiotus metropolitanus TaxID=2943436 RepID=UPI002445AFA9|nr:uncharacterized protein LOC129588764 [Paramacrobiotus metropolitanus]
MASKTVLFVTLAGSFLLVSSASLNLSGGETVADPFSVGDTLTNLETQVNAMMDRARTQRDKRYASDDCSALIDASAVAYNSCARIVRAGYTSRSCRETRLNVYIVLGACLREVTGVDRENVFTIYGAWKRLDL